MTRDPADHPHGADISEPIPSAVGRYRIEGVIGRGAMGIVFKGHDDQIDRPVAIKGLRRDIINHVEDRASLLQRFSSEARSAGRCQHANIVTVFDYIEQDDAPFIVMEYVAAGTLENVTKSTALMPIRQVGEILAQLLAALGHAHDNGVVHRDIKPANILCPTPSTIKVTDFGVARVDALGLTAVGSAVGTPSYMSPEQFLGQSVDARSDLFAAGVLLFQLLTGTKPFKAQGIPALMHKVLNEPPPQLSSVRPELSPLLNDVVHRALARHPDDRFSSAEEFAKFLAPAIANVDEDQTMPLDLTQAMSRPGPGEASDGASNSQSSFNRTMAEQMTPDTLSTIETALARSIGPIAKLVLRRATLATSDASQLVATLAAEIPGQAEAERFRKEIERTLLRSNPMSSTGGLEVQASPAASISTEEIQHATDALLPIIGPMARIIAKRAGEKCASRDQFYRLVSESIPDLDARAEFLAKHLN